MGREGKAAPTFLILLRMALAESSSVSSSSAASRSRTAHSILSGPPSASRHSALRSNA